VSLTVTGANGSHTTTKNNYINVMGMPGQSATPVGPTQLCQNQPNTSYTTTGTAHATQYIWTLLPNAAGTITGTGLSASVTWSPDFHGQAEVMVMGVNSCGQGTLSLPLTATLDPLPEAAGQIEGSHEVCQSFTDIYTVAQIGHSNSYNWMLTPAEAGAMVINSNEATITWAPDFEGTAVLKVCGVNNCGEGTISANFEIVVENCTGIQNYVSDQAISIYPNPNSGSFTLNLDVNDEVVIKMVNAIGEVVYLSEKVTLNGQFIQTIELDLPNGVYYFKVEGNSTNLVEKIVISK